MIGLVVFSNNSGIGIQSRRLCYLLKPNKLLAIDSSGFSKNTTQHWEWYSQFKGIMCKGFPTNREIDEFLKGLSSVFCIENPLNFHLLDRCKELGIKLYIQSNYEFCDHLNRDLVLPTKFLMPSYWMIDKMRSRFGDDKVMYLPPPINPSEFNRAREYNLHHTSHRYLHIVGTLAAEDRNGTLDLIRAIQQSKEDYKLVIRSQHQLPAEYLIKDPRVTYEMHDALKEEDMYKGFDALILPRRYGGLSLVCNEALMSALPVIMPDISPNNQLLPKRWLMPTKVRKQLMTRTLIDVYETDTDALAHFLDTYQTTDADKIEAFGIGYDQFAESQLLPQYLKLL